MTTKPKKYFRNYTEAALKDAVSAIKSGLSFRKASEKYGVPIATLHYRVSGKVPELEVRMGPSPYLTEAEEKKIVDWCIKLAKCGFPRKEPDILDTVQQFIKDENRVTPFKNGRPGRTWYESFLKRNAILVYRTAENLSKGRAVITEQFIRQWFRDLEDYLKSINQIDILSDPNRILNGDETSFCLCPKTGKVLAPKGLKNVYSVKMGNEKDTLTVLLVFSAAGKTLPLMVVFPYKRIPADIVKNMPEEWIIGKSESGWMRGDTFHDYIANCVHKWAEEQNFGKPILLFVDGHKSHLTLQLSEFCSKNGIILYALPPNTTHIMQPADVSVFKPLKGEWKKPLENGLRIQTPHIQRSPDLLLPLFFKWF